MNFLRKLYKGPFNLEKKVVKPFVIRLVVYVILNLVIGSIWGALEIGILVLTGAMDTLAVDIVCYVVIMLLALVYTVIGAYLLGGVVISILKFVGVIKDNAGLEEGEPNTAVETAGKDGGFFDKVVDKTTGVVSNVVDKVTDKKDDSEDSSEDVATEEEVANDAE